MRGMGNGQENRRVLVSHPITPVLTRGYFLFIGTLPLHELSTLAPAAIVQ